MHNAQRNLLVLGLIRPEDYRSLPASGNPGLLHVRLARGGQWRADAVGGSRSLAVAATPAQF